MIYSPFTPYFHFPQFRDNVQHCWIATDCLFENAGESRKQQFAATALVMGLIPFTIKDIAWPERRLMYVTKRLHWSLEILVLALGLVPMETRHQKTTRRKGCEGTTLASYGWTMHRHTLKLWIWMCVVAVSVGYAALALMEVFSKRSALGCPYPFSIATWHVVALIPAAVHSLFASLRRRRYQTELIRRVTLQSRQDQHDILLEDVSGTPSNQRSKRFHHTLRSNGEEGDDIDERNDRDRKLASAVQGADEEWPVQMAWGVYYITGTLVFTSIMAVTVIELAVWVVLGLATTACSKILAFSICLVFEETGVPPSVTEVLAERSVETGSLGAVGNVVDRRR
jgi:hypothetical protein